MTASWNQECRPTTTATRAPSVAAVINQAMVDRRAAFDLRTVNPTGVDVANPVALATRGIWIVKARELPRRTLLPDPHLVAVTAAANWFAGRNQRMLVAASVYDSPRSGSDKDDDSGYNDHWSPLR